MPSSRLLVPLALTLAACAPMAGAIPIATMQNAGPATPTKSTTAIGVGLGAGGMEWVDPAGGGAIAHRVPIGEHTELELGGQAVIHSCSGCKDSRQGQHLSALTRIGMKWHTGDRWAVMTGASYGAYPGGKALGADFGLVANVREIGYASLRLGAATPVVRTEGDFSSDDMLALSTTYWSSAALGLRARGFLAEFGLGLLTNFVENGEANSGAAAWVMVGAEM